MFESGAEHGLCDWRASQLLPRLFTSRDTDDPPSPAAKSASQTLAGSSVLGIVRADGERVLEANDAFLHMVGYARVDLEAGMIRWRDMTPLEYAEDDRLAIEESLATGIVKPYPKECFRKDGTRVHLVFGGVLADRSGPVWIGFLVECSNIAAREARLRADRASLELVVRRHDHFLATLSHELRQPLTAMLGGLDVLELEAQVRTPETTKTRNRALTVLRRQTNHLTKLVDDLLFASRIQNGRIELVRRVLDASELVRDVVDELTAVAQAGRTTLILSPRTAPAWVDADPTRLRQVVSNLLSNALKFTPDGVVEVTVEADAEGGRVLLRVRDTGRGLTADELPHIFEPFIQFDAPRERGLGLGLSVARTLVALHGGELTAASDGRGKGAAFTVSLPAARVA